MIQKIFGSEFADIMFQLPMPYLHLAIPEVFLALMQSFRHFLN